MSNAFDVKVRNAFGYADKWKNPKWAGQSKEERMKKEEGERRKRRGK
jgi:hypothetical protein